MTDKKPKVKSGQTVKRSIVLGENALQVLPPDSSEPVEFAKGFELTPNGMKVTGKPPFNRWERVGRALCSAERRVRRGPLLPDRRLRVRMVASHL